jgi:MFS family permease
MQRQPLITTVFVGLLYIAGNLSNAIYPVYVTSFIAGRYANTSNVGVLATAEFLPFGLSILLAGRFLPERHLRLIAGASLVAHLVTSYATTRLPFVALIPCRAIFGIAGGMLLWISYAYVARSTHSGRLVAIYTTALMTLGVIWSWVAPNLILPAFGHPGVIMFMVVPSFLALLLLAFGPRELAPLTTAVDQGGTRSRRTLPASSLLVLFSIGMWAAFMTIIWVYSEPLAALHTGALIQRWLTVSLVCQILGAAASALFAERLPYRTIVSCGLVISVAQLVSYYLGVSSVGFVLWSGVGGFIGYFLYPFYIRALIETDATRRSVVYFPAAFNLAGSLGPIVVSGFVSDTDLSSGLLIDLGAISIAAVMFWAALVVLRRQRVTEAASDPTARSQLLP